MSMKNSSINNELRHRVRRLRPLSKDGALSLFGSSWQDGKQTNVQNHCIRRQLPNNCLSVNPNPMPTLYLWVIPSSLQLLRLRATKNSSASYSRLSDVTRGSMHAVRDVSLVANPLLHFAGVMSHCPHIYGTGYTYMPRVATFRSTTDRIYDGGPIRLQYNIIITVFSGL
jgi:hypothetical protein